MILVVSDGSSSVLGLTEQLEIRDESYIVYFTDFLSAGKMGRGSAIVGDGTARSIKSALIQNRAYALIDAVAEPRSDISLNAVSACGTKVKYIKYLNMDETFGIRKCLSYTLAAELIQKSHSALVLTQPVTAQGIAEAGGQDVSAKMFALIPKSAVFDTETALKYGLPLLNISECDGIEDAGIVSAMAERRQTDLIICDSAYAPLAKAVAENLGVNLVITHSMGMEYPNPSASARDAVLIARERYL